MKRILAVIGSLSCLTASVSLVGCSFEQDKETYIKNLIYETAESASYAVRAGITSSNLNFDPNYVMSHYGNQYVKDVFPDQFSQFQKNLNINNSSNMYKLWSETFKGVNSSYNWTNNNDSKAGISFKGTQNPFDASLQDVLNQIAPLLVLLSQGFSANTASNVLGLFKSDTFASIRKSAASLAPYMKSGFLNGMSKAFKDSQFDGFTYSQLLTSAGICFYNFLNSITKTPQDYMEPATKSPDFDTLQSNMNTAFENIFKNGANFNITTLLGEHGLPDLLEGLNLLGIYISQFHLNIKATDDDHLFSTSEDNITYKQQIWTKTFSSSDDQPTFINIQKIVHMLLVFFTADNTKDPYGYNTLKLLNILFVNHTPAELEAFQSFNDLAIPTFNEIPSSEYKGTDNIFLPIIKGVIDGGISTLTSKIKLPQFVQKAIATIIENEHFSTLIYKIIYDVSNNAPSFTKARPDAVTKKNSKSTVDFILEINIILDNIKTLVPIKDLAKYLSDAENIVTSLADQLTNKTKTPNGIYEALYSDDKNNGRLIGKLMTFFNNDPKISSALADLGVKFTIPEEYIENIPDIQHVFTAKLPDFLKNLFGLSLPNWAYFLHNWTWTDTIQNIALDFEVKDRYTKDAFPNGNIPTLSLSNMFAAMGQTADKTFEKQHPGETIPTISGVDPKTTSTMAYALDMIPLTDDPNAGPDGAFQLLGLNTKEGSFYPDSMFAALNKLYYNGNQGMTKIFGAVGKILTSITTGMQNHEKQDFLPHLENSHFLLDPNIKISRPKSGVILATFNIDYSDTAILDQKIIYTLQIEFDNVDETGGNLATLQWVSAKKIPRS